MAIFILLTTLSQPLLFKTQLTFPTCSTAMIKHQKIATVIPQIFVIKTLSDEQEAINERVFNLAKLSAPNVAINLYIRMKSTV